MPNSLPAVLMIALALAGCSGAKGDFPSLARRPVERIAEAPPQPEATPAPPAAPGADVLGRLAELSRQARAAHERFSARQSRADSLTRAAAGAPLASESWAVATVALSELESARSDAMIALAELDGLYAARRIEGSDTQAVAATRDEVSALVGQEDAALAALRARLRS